MTNITVTARIDKTIKKTLEKKAIERSVITGKIIPWTKILHEVIRSGMKKENYKIEETKKQNSTNFEQ